MSVPAPNKPLLAAFLRRYWQDLEDGDPRSLEEYLDEFPGDGVGIAREFMRCKEQGTTGDTTRRLDQRTAVLAEFLKAYGQDRRSNQIKELDAYQARFPGFEDVVEEHFRRVQKDPRDTIVGTQPMDHIGPYRLEEEIGAGGQGVVYKATDTRMGRSVALKALRGFVHNADEAMERFRREAIAASKAEHPGVCPVYDADVDRGVPYIAMRFIKGETLATHIATSREQASGGTTTAVQFDSTVFDDDVETEPEPREDPGVVRHRSDMLRILHLFEHIASALHAVHEVGIIHRDVKPGNVMVTDQGEAVVMDFGLARDNEGDLETLTRSGDLFGTPAYMSPEQLARRAITLDRRTDVWSLGVTLYESLALCRPFAAETREALYQAIMTKEPVPLRKRDARIPRDLEAVVQRSLEKDRDRRYSSALEFAEDLARVRTGRPTLARPVSLMGRGTRWCRRNPALATSLTALLLAVVLGGALLSELLGRSDSAGPQPPATARATAEVMIAAATRLDYESACQHLGPAAQRIAAAVADHNRAVARLDKTLRALQSSVGRRYGQSGADRSGIWQIVDSGLSTTVRDSLPHPCLHAQYVVSVEEVDDERAIVQLETRGFAWESGVTSDAAQTTPSPSTRFQGGMYKIPFVRKDGRWRAGVLPLLESGDEERSFRIRFGFRTDEAFFAFFETRLKLLAAQISRLTRAASGLDQRVQAGELAPTELRLRLTAMASEFAAESSADDEALSSLEAALGLRQGTSGAARRLARNMIWLKLGHPVADLLSSIRAPEVQEVPPVRLPESSHVGQDDAFDKSRVELDIVDRDYFRKHGGIDLDPDKPPVLLDGRQIDGVSHLRLALRSRADPYRFPDRERGMIGVNPTMYASSVPILVRCDQYQVFGWVQAAMHACTFVPGAKWADQLASSPLIYKFELGFRQKRRIVYYLPTDRGLSGQQESPPPITLRVHADDRAKKPRDRRVVFSHAGRDQPFGMRSAMGPITGPLRDQLLEYLKKTWQEDLRVDPRVPWGHVASVMDLVVLSSGQSKAARTSKRPPAAPVPEHQRAVATVLELNELPLTLTDFRGIEDGTIR